MSSHILYYSEFCPFCEKLFVELRKSQMIRQFTRLICVDNREQEEVIIPDEVVVVPTVITSDYQIPLVDDGLYRWLDFKKLQRVQKTQELIVQQHGPLPPAMYGATDSNMSGKKKTLLDFEQLQKLRDSDDTMFQKI